MPHSLEAEAMVPHSLEAEVMVPHSLEAERMVPVIQTPEAPETRLFRLLPAQLWSSEKRKSARTWRRLGKRYLMYRT